MKRFLTAALIVITAALSLAGCSENSSSADPGDSSVTGSISDDNSLSKCASDHSYDTSNVFGLVLPNTRAGALAAKALAADQWGDMLLLETDEELAVGVSDKLTFDMLEDSCFIAAAADDRKHFVFIAKPKAGGEDTIHGIFNGIFHQYKNDPNAGYNAHQKQDAAGTVTGVTGDGYYYIVVHENGAKIADTMVG